MVIRPLRGCKNLLRNKILVCTGSPISLMDKVPKSCLGSITMYEMMALQRCLKMLRLSTSCQEKFYFNPGDTGFKVFNTRYGKIGVAICWDQWFPEAARAMVLQGAEVLLYPTAIGSEPQDQGLDSREHWRRVMQGHAGATLVPLVASNRIGKETIETEHGNSDITFYDNSFIAGKLVISHFFILPDYVQH
ncbi:hypothetical protein MLD38_040224 [Melastoma candidum]|uniref:Uncharacterized protein n=1 Tax=Melastoma candidum TaxID=119954 RepID=A0ACB9L513_9MYRT|nr:hypothetical protein MLD38_040224 [Melastoma candidum]